eukprot:TRINITY_DN6967_c0_g1_i1.p1 TRINITY_DN6967_c0_g1~~TRINITY_DN6967_c0_g1_i1.p1  ORF type:complete len:349 (+),score=86.92 TRINITY_DN6967_c0_g1_i1:353-1399(+)
MGQAESSAVTPPGPRNKRSIVVRKDKVGGRLGVDLGSDLVIAKVVKGGCAEKAGLEAGMRVCEINGMPLKTEEDGIRAVGLGNGLEVCFTVHNDMFTTYTVSRLSLTEKVGVELGSDLIIAGTKGPAAAAGLLSGMRVVTINDTYLTTEEDGVQAVIQSGLTTTFKIRSEPTPAASVDKATVLVTVSREAADEKLGIELSPANVVINVVPDSPAALSGLTPGMVLAKVDGQRDVKHGLAQAGTSILFEVTTSDTEADRALKPLMSLLSSLPTPLMQATETVVECCPRSFLACDVIRISSEKDIPKTDLEEYGGDIVLKPPPPAPVTRTQPIVTEWEAPSPGEAAYSIP